MNATWNTMLIAAALIGVAAPSVTAAGGDTCGTATLVMSVPYSDNGSTCAANNDYDEECNTNADPRDVVYSFKPQADICVHVSLCGGTNFNAKLYVYSSATGNCPQPPSNDTGLDIACAQGGCPGGGGVPRIGNLQLAAGVTYWIVIDGDFDACGDYQLTINPCGESCGDDADCCDGDFCNGREICGANGVCQPGTLDCNDNNPCTVDTCDADLETCVHTPIPDCCLNHEQCDDGNQCTNDVCDRPDSCDTGTCVYTPRAAGAPCGDPRSRPCDQPDTCNGEGACKPNHVPDESPCNDGQFCTQSTTCQGGVCGGGTQRDCDDANPCTLDRCDEETQSCASIVNENCCQTNDECDDGNECTADVCADLTCLHPPLAMGTPCGSDAVTPCSDADTCQQGICRPNHVANGEACDDGDECTVADTCFAGSCKGQPDPTCAAGPAEGGLHPVARKLSFQAFLTETNGEPVDGPRDLTFQLYDEQGTPIGPVVDVHDVMVQHGVLSTQIPVPYGTFDGARELGVQVDGGSELSPRIPFSAAAHALSVDSVGSSELSEHLDLGGGTTGGELRIYGPAGAAAGGGSGTASFVAGTRTDLDDLGVLRICGKTDLADDSGDVTVMIDACEPSSLHPALTGSGGGQIQLADTSGDVMIELDASSSDDAAAELILYQNNGADVSVKLVGSETGSDGGQLIMRNSQDELTVVLDSESNANGAHLYLRDEDGNHRMVEIVSTETGNDGAQIVLRQADGIEGVQIDAESDTGAKIRLYQNDYNPSSSSLSDDIGILIDGNYTDGGGSTGYGRIRVRNESGESTVTIDGDYDDSGKGRVRTDILRIDGGSDFSEAFDVRGDDVQPGYLVSIDPQNAGKLEVSAAPYDHRLAGVISGAGGIDPGLIMSQTGSIADGAYPVAMSGRVYCWADASHGAIEPGDLLTTSDVPGHAMRAENRDRAHGAVIGKAMSSLTEGRGLVLVLIRPQ